MFLGSFYFYAVRKPRTYRTNIIQMNSTYSGGFKAKRPFHSSRGAKTGSSFGTRSQSSFSSGPSRFGGSRTGSSYGSAPRSGGSRFSGGRRFSKPKRSFGESIDVSKFIYKPTGVHAAPVYEVKHQFADFKFTEPISRNLEMRGFTTPTPIQDQTITHAMEGRDVIGLASTGSGKTGAFLLPLIEKLAQDRHQKVLILAPTRELAMQINEELRAFSHGMRLYSTLCVGGMSIYNQIQHLRRLNHFVIGTPGRLQDLSDRKVIDFSEFQNIVIDEFDHMLDMGFIDAITAILKKLPEERQSLFFSATMPPRIKTIVHDFLKDPVSIDIGSGISTKNVEQDVVRVIDRRHKLVELEKILSMKDATRTIIFVETKKEVESLHDDLKAKGINVAYLHGDKRQRERERTLRSFKDGHTNVLIATDVAARGIDVKDVSHVINYTIPQTHDNYVHRIGRTGRGGKIGKAFTFVTV